MFVFSLDVLTLFYCTGHAETSSNSFPLPAGAHVVDPTVIQGQQQQQQQQQPGQQHLQQQQQQQHFAPSPYVMIPPPRQILLCPPGALPAPQSISALSTPGQMQSWHHQQQFRPQQHPSQRNNYIQQQQQRQQFMQQQQHQQQFMPQMNIPPQGLNVAQGLTPLPPVPPLNDASSTENSSVDAPPKSVRRGPPAEKGGVVPPVNPPTPLSTVHIASGLGGSQQPPVQMQPPFPRPQMHPQQQFRHVAPAQKGPRLPCGSRMNHSDVRFVVGKVLQTTETHDPFNDDFYFIQVII
jgi:hypothetical protein